MLVKTTPEVRAAADLLIKFIAEAQRGQAVLLSGEEGKFAYENLQKDYDVVQAYQEEEVDVAEWGLS